MMSTHDIRKFEQNRMKQMPEPSGNSGELEDQQDIWDELGNEINKIIHHEDAFGVHPALNILKNKYTITRK